MPAVNGDGSLFTWSLGSEGDWNLLIGRWVSLDLRESCPSEVYAAQQEIGQPHANVLDLQGHTSDQRPSMSADGTRLAHATRGDLTGTSDEYVVHVLGTDTFVANVSRSIYAWYTPRPQISADGSTLWYLQYSDAIVPWCPSSTLVTFPGDTECVLGGLIPGVTQSALSADGSVIAGVFYDGSAMEVRRLTRNGSNWCTTPTSQTLAVSIVHYQHQMDTGIDQDAYGIFDVTISADGSRVAWSSVTDHCSTTTPRAELSSRDIWVWFENDADVPGWMSQCAGDSHLARVADTDLDNSLDGRVVLAGSGDILLFTSDANIDDPFTALRRPTLFALDLAPSHSSFANAWERVSAGATPTHRVLWSALSHDGRVATWQEANVTESGDFVAVTGADIWMVTLDWDEASPQADGTNVIPNEPLDADITDCFSASGHTQVEVRLRQWSGGQRRLLILGEVTNGSVSHAYGPVVQSLDDGQFVDVVIEAKALAGTPACTLRVLDASQAQMDVVDLEVP